MKDFLKISFKMQKTHINLLQNFENEHATLFFNDRNEFCCCKNNRNKMKINKKIKFNFLFFKTKKQILISFFIYLLLFFFYQKLIKILHFTLFFLK